MSNPELEFFEMQEAAERGERPWPCPRCGGDLPPETVLVYDSVCPKCEGELREEVRHA